MKEYKLKLKGKDYNVAVFSIEDKTAEVSVNGVRYRVEIEGESTPEPLLRPVLMQPRPTEAPKPSPKARKESPVTGGGKTVSSPLPGVVLSITVKEGQNVQRGQKMAVVEAMKMENDILAPVDGVVSTVYVSVGESVLEGAKLLTIK